MDQWVIITKRSLKIFESISTGASPSSKIKGYKHGGHGLMVIVVGNGHGDTSSNPERD